MIKLQKQALDKAHALMFATNLLAKSSSERCAIVGTNPLLVREWMHDLLRWRAQSQREIELLDQAIEDLCTAQRLMICKGEA